MMTTKINRAELIEVLRDELAGWTIGEFVPCDVNLVARISRFCTTHRMKRRKEVHA